MRFPVAEGAFPPWGTEEEVAALAVGCRRLAGGLLTMFVKTLS